MNEFNELWRKHNDYDDNKDYIDKILKRFKVHKYNVTVNQWGGTDLLIEQGLRKYKIELDYDKCVAYIKRGKMTYRSSKDSKEYMPIKKTISKDSIWYDAIKWVYNDLSIL